MSALSNKQWGLACIRREEAVNIADIKKKARTGVMTTTERYKAAKELYREIGVDTDAALKILKKIPISLHCWQGDDVGGFDRRGPLTGGIQATGNYPGKARTPEELMAYCDENDLPLLTVPWEVRLSDMIKDFSIRVFVQDNTDEQIATALIAAIETPDNQTAYRRELWQYFDVDGSFQVLLLTCEGLDAMDMVERRKLSYRIQVYLEDITHNASFFYYNSDFVLVANAVPEEALYQLIEGAIKRGEKRMPERKLRVGIGSKCMDISRLSVSYRRAKAAVQMAMAQKRQVVKFDDCGLYRLLYMVEDTGVLQEIETECLAALEEYDRKYNAGYVETLQSYLKHNGSIQAVAEELYTHRNTVLYRLGNIRKVLGNELKTPEERLPYQMAFYIRSMHGVQERSE